MPDWFVRNVADVPAKRSDKEGMWIRLGDDEVMPQFGVTVTAIWPGQTSSAYHAENLQEDFLVLSGECIAIVEGDEIRMRAWDFLHCPPGTRHVFVGAGEGPCAIVMVGARDLENEELLYPRDELAARYGAESVNAPTDGPGAYEGWPEADPLERMRWPPPDDPV